MRGEGWNGSLSVLQGTSVSPLLLTTSSSSSSFDVPDFADGLCSLTIKSSSNVKGSYGSRTVIQQQEAAAINARAFADLPSFLQHAILHSAWQEASSRSEQHALRCSCRAAKTFTDSVIDAADLSISTVYVDAAVRALSRFPAQASLKHLTIRRAWECGPAEAAACDAATAAETGCSEFFNAAQGLRAIEAVDRIILTNMALSSCDTEAILQACPNLSQLAIRGGICAGPLFLRLSLCSLVALELTGCLSRQREQFESLCCLTALTKLSLTLAKGRTILLRDLTPFFARLPLLSDLHVAGLELYKQDLTAVQPLAKLQHLTRLELRQHVLIFATYKTVARGIRGSVALQSRTLAGLTRLTSLALPDNTLVGDDAMIVVCMPCLRELVVYGLFNSPLSFHGAASSALRALSITCEMPMDANRVAALVQLTRLTALSFKSSLGRGAAEMVLSMPLLELLSAKQLLPDDRTPVADAAGNAAEGPVRVAPNPYARQHLSSSGGRTLRQVRLHVCDAPAQLLMLPRSVTQLGILSTEWTVPADGAAAATEPADPPAAGEAPVLQLSPSVRRFLSQAHSASQRLRHSWCSSLSNGERGLSLRSPAALLAPLLAALAPLIGPQLSNLQVAATQVDARLMRLLSSAAPQLRQLHLRRCHLLPGACSQLPLLMSLQQLALTWTSFKYEELAGFICAQVASAARAGGEGTLFEVCMEHGIHQQRVFERLSEELGSRGRGHLADVVTAFNEDAWQGRRQVKVIWQQEEEQE